jgi:hypothetical protein
MLARFFHFNRFILRPVMLILGPPLLFICLVATPIGVHVFIVLIGMLLFVLWIGIGLFGAERAFRAGRRHAWREVVSWFTVPLVIGLGTIEWQHTMIYTSFAGQALSFAANLPLYLRQIEKLPNDGVPKLEVFNRGGMIWASSGVVYDESDEVRLPPGEQSAEWQERAKQSELGCGNFSMTPLFRHFYLAGFSC